MFSSAAEEVIATPAYCNAPADDILTAVVLICNTLSVASPSDITLNVESIPELLLDTCNKSL